MTDCQRLRVVFAGTPDFAAIAMQALLKTQHQIVGVLTQPCNNQSLFKQAMVI